MSVKKDIRKACQTFCQILIRDKDRRKILGRQKCGKDTAFNNILLYFFSSNYKNPETMSVHALKKHCCGPSIEPFGKVVQNEGIQVSQHERT